MNGRAYTSTVLGNGQLTFGLGCAAASGITIAVCGGPRWIAAAAAAAIALMAFYLATVRIAIGETEIRLGIGPWNRPSRKLDPSSVVAARPLTLRRLHTLGIGMGWHPKTTRLTVRPGPTLELELDSGEHIRISTPRPDTACELLQENRKDTI